MTLRRVQLMFAVALLAAVLATAMLIGFVPAAFAQAPAQGGAAEGGLDPFALLNLGDLLKGLIGGG